MQYALLIYSTEESTPEERRAVEAGVAPVLARPYVTNWARLHAPQSATTVRQQQGETLLTDGPFVDSKEFLGGLIFIDVDNLDVALAVAAELQALRPSSAIEVRPRTGTRSPVAVEGVFRDHWGRVLATLVGMFRDIELAEDAAQEAFAIAAERWPPGRRARQPGRLADHDGTEPGDRPDPPAAGARREDQVDRPRAHCAPGTHDGRAGHLPRRAPRADLHLLPPGAVPRGAGGADPPDPGRPVDRGDRARVPDPVRHDEQAPDPRQAQDPGRGHPVRRAGGSPAPRPARGRPRGRLPHLQRGLGRWPGRPGRRGDPAGPGAGRAHAGRVRGPRAAGADAAERRPPRRPGARGCARPAGRAGPVVVGRAADRSRVASCSGGRCARPGAGTYVIQAAIADLHLQQPRDWHQIAALYGTLAQRTGSSVVELNRAVAIAELDGPDAGLAVLDTLALDDYRYYHSTRAASSVAPAERPTPAAAYPRALELAETDPERQFLAHRPRNWPDPTGSCSGSAISSRRHQRRTRACPVDQLLFPPGVPVSRFSGWNPLPPLWGRGFRSLGRDGAGGAGAAGGGGAGASAPGLAGRGWRAG